MMPPVKETGCWQCGSNDTILEFLRIERWCSSELISREVSADASERRVRERYCVLAHVGLISLISDNAGAEMFEITDWDELYLRGEVDAELFRPIPKLRPPDKVRPGDWAGVV